MQLRCKHCGQEIRSDDINLDTMLAKCWSCHGIYDFSAEVRAEREDDEAAPALRKRRSSVPMPEGITIELGEEQTSHGAVYREPGRTRQDLKITRRWFSASYVFMILFAIVWDGFLIHWYAGAFSNGTVDIAALLFPLLHVAAGVSITYAAAAGLINTTVIAVTGQQLAISHGPLPWLGNKTIAVEELDQLFCEEKIHRGKNGTTKTYDVSAILRGGRSLRLLKGLTDVQQALFIEQSIEENLGIIDVEVPGELDAH